MNISVGNLSYDVTEADLRASFEAFGAVASVSIIKDQYSGQSKGFGFVEMGFQEHLPENVRLEGITDWLMVPFAVKTAG
jgi:RNA recognition motif. (a.k.a. RRM, RBD, or RNP domain)